MARRADESAVRDRRYSAFANSRALSRNNFAARSMFAFSLIVLCEATF